MTCAEAGVTIASDPSAINPEATAAAVRKSLPLRIAFSNPSLVDVPRCEPLPFGHSQPPKRKRCRGALGSSHAAAGPRLTTTDAPLKLGEILFEKRQS